MPRHKKSKGKKERRERAKTRAEEQRLILPDPILAAHAELEPGPAPVKPTRDYEIPGGEIILPPMSPGGREIALRWIGIKRAEEIRRA